MEDVEIVEDSFIVSMKYRIIYLKDDGNLGIIIPMHPTLTKEQIASKDVPEGKPYKIIETQELPEDITFRNAWTFDFSKPDGFGMNNELWHSQNSQEFPEMPELITMPIQEESND